jgi:aminoglycoside phosphotransferase (APT) family kinase protein
MSCTGGGRLQHESAVLASLGGAPGLTDVRHLIPTRRAEGMIQGWRYVLDDYLEGLDASDALAATPGLRAALELSGATAVTALHRATARPTSVDDETLRRWVDEPIQILRRGLRRITLRASPRGLDTVQARLHQALRGREVYSGWIHGDYWLGNIRVDPVSGKATGIIDWDCAGQDELPAHDLLHLALYGLSIERGVSLGAVVAETVRCGTWPAQAEGILRHGRWAWADGLADADVALLYWLRYISMMMVQQRDYVDHSILMWEWRNVACVLRSL